MDDRPSISLEELQPVSFLPVWIYYSIRQRGGLADRNQLGLIRMIDTVLSPPSDPSAWVIDFLKINLHKLYDQFLGSISMPDFSRMDIQLQEALDILLLHAVADPRIEALRRLLAIYCGAVAAMPIPPDASPVAGELMLQRAKAIQKMLG